MFIIRFLAALALLSAGAIHTFPALWLAWDRQMQETPHLHNTIGLIAFSLGILNLLLLFYKPKKNY
ncbi:hypothetical protein HOB10_03880 [Candidatus Parcubacteria bacterium]|jgi:hypothetical protein|nr:hypothetical protein [Candidatus Parcubacteria bacterium]